MLVERIDAFIADPAQPRPLRENLHTLREIGNFGAHTERDYLDKIIEVDADEAEWTVNVIGRLLDHFIATPESDRKMRERFGAKREAAGKAPLPELPADEDSP